MLEDKLVQKLAFKETVSQSDQLADRIKAMIADRELKEGDSFPNEVEFCRILNVGRTTLREAYKILDTEGFIRRTKRGTFVKSRDDIASKGNFQASLILAEKRELLEFICILEPEAVAIAANTITSEELDELKKLLIKCEASKDDVAVFLQENSNFHAYIRGLCHNNIIISALEAYHESFDSVIIENIYASGADVRDFRDNSLSEHRELYEAMRNHDAVKAKQIEYQHLKEDIDFLKENDQ